MTRSKKPNFTLNAGWWLNPDFLSHDLLHNLRIWAGESDLDPEQQGKLIAFANEYAQRPNQGDEPIAVAREMIGSVADNAHRLVNSLRALNEQAIAAMTLYAADARFPDPESGTPAPLSADMIDRMKALDRIRMDSPEQIGFLDEAWEWVNALRVVADHANSQRVASRQDKPKQLRARAMVSALTDCYIQLAGKAPPHNPGTWFHGFVELLGSHMGLEVGPKVLKSGIAQAKR